MVMVNAEIAISLPAVKAAVFITMVVPLVPVNFGGAILAPANVEGGIREDVYIGAIPDIKPANFYVVPRDIETSA